MIQQRKSTIKTPWNPRPFMVTKVNGSQLEVKRGEEVKKRALNLIKKIKFRKEERETENRDDEDPEIDISIEEIRRRIREEKEAAGVAAQENSKLEESTDSDFTITYEGVPVSPRQDSEEEADKSDLDTSKDTVSLGKSNDEKEASGGKATQLSPRQRLRRQSLARFSKKRWGKEWIV